MFTLKVSLNNMSPLIRLKIFRVKYKTCCIANYVGIRGPLILLVTLTVNIKRGHNRLVEVFSFL